MYKEADGQKTTYSVEVDSFLKLQRHIFVVGPFWLICRPKPHSFEHDKGERNQAFSFEHSKEIELSPWQPRKVWTAQMPRCERTSILETWQLKLFVKYFYFPQKESIDTRPFVSIEKSLDTIQKACSIYWKPIQQLCIYWKTISCLTV